MRAGMSANKNWCACFAAKLLLFAFIASFVLFGCLLLFLFLSASYSPDQGGSKQLISGSYSETGNAVMQVSDASDDLQYALKSNPGTGIQIPLRPGNLRGNQLLKLHPFPLRWSAIAMVLSVCQWKHCPTVSVRFSFLQVFFKTISPVRAGPFPY